MHFRHALLCLCFGLTAEQARPVELRPLSGMGQVRLGMSRAEVAALALPARPDPNPNVEWRGPFRVVYREDRVAVVQLPLHANPVGALWRGKALTSSRTVEELAAALPGCILGDATAPGVGGQVIRCQGAKLRRSTHELWLDVDADCGPADYASPILVTSTFIEVLSPPRDGRWKYRLHAEGCGFKVRDLALVGHIGSTPLGGLQDREGGFRGLLERLPDAGDELCVGYGAPQCTGLRFDGRGEFRG